MENAIRYIRGLYTLGLGSPFYRHAAERDVPWPHLDNPLRGADEQTIQKWIAAGAMETEIRAEVERLNRIEISPEGQGPVVSNHLHKPSRVTYTTQLPYFTQIPCRRISDTLWEWRGQDPDFPGDLPPLPGHCILHEFRLILRPEARIRKVVLKMGSKVMREAQSFGEDPESLINMLQTYLGIPLVVSSEAERMVTLPFFFSRDPCYGLPIFVVGGVDILLELENQGDQDPVVSLSLAVLHSREEVKQIRLSHLHRLEDLSDDLKGPYHEVDRWVYMNCFWKTLAPNLIQGGRARILYEGRLDEEVRGIFWRVSDPECNVGLTYTFEGGEVIHLVDNHPCQILAENELRTRLLPTISGSFLVPTELRKHYGGILLSRYVDSVDCEPGLSPRNGELYLEFSNPEVEIDVYLLTNRDHIIL